MGGDNAPAEIIEGALLALPQIRRDLILVGDETTIRKHLPTHLPPRLQIVHASQIVEMDEKPLDAYRKKKDSSMMVGVKLVKDGKAEAFVSAGSTGAASETRRSKRGSTPRPRVCLGSAPAACICRSARSEAWRHCSNRPRPL